jgi:transcriptional regulator with XRE-family HTH domain
MAHSSWGKPKIYFTVFPTLSSNCVAVTRPTPGFDEPLKITYRSNPMVIGDRLRELRETKHLSQGDIEKRTGLLRCYISRVENSHTVPNVATLEKLAASYDVPLWKIFHEGDQPARPLLPNRDLDHSEPVPPEDRKYYLKLARLLGRMSEKDRHLLFYAAQRMDILRRRRKVKNSK